MSDMTGPRKRALDEAKRRLDRLPNWALRRAEVVTFTVTNTVPPPGYPDRLVQLEWPISLFGLTCTLFRTIYFVERTRNGATQQAVRELAESYIAKLREEK